MRRFQHLLIASSLTLLALVGANTAIATEVQDLVRIRGQGESVIVGLGLVLGLPGTGDSGKDLSLARPLSEMLKNGGNAVGSLKELSSSKSAALVSVTCTIKASGVLVDDCVDVTVSVINSASSLRGGRLFLCPLTGPRAGSEVFAFAEGAVDVEDPATPTTGRVRGGARMVKTTRESAFGGDTLDLILKPEFAGIRAAQQVASSIDVQYQTDPNARHSSIAQVIDDRAIRVTIPEAERPQRAAFIADVLATPVNVALLGLPAQVVCNQRSGAIIVTGDVEISPGIITHKDLVLTTTVPAPVPTALDPLITRSRWVAVSTDKGAPASQNAKLMDLLTAFKQLDVPVPEQITILQMLSKSGRLRASLIVD